MYETTERKFWSELAKCNQEEFRKSETEGQCIEARELIIALPESFTEYYPRRYVLALFTDHFKEQYGVECIAALHHNKRKTNYHIHLIFSERKKLEEPIVKAEIILPKDYVGPIMELCQQRRGEYISMEYMDENRVMLVYHMPLNEIIYDFFDVLKSRSRGYASFDYSLLGYQEASLTKLDILVNKEVVDALSFIVHSSSAVERGRKICEKLKKEIPRQLFEIPIQAAIGAKIVARETVSAMRKDVLAKCYGGDISRKRKLLEKQKEGKKRMRQIGNVVVPQAAFMSVLKLEEE